MNIRDLDPRLGEAATKCLAGTSNSETSLHPQSPGTTMMRTLLPFLIFALTAAALLGDRVSAQPYPSKPLKIVLPFPPGSTVDISARLIGAKMSEKLGQPVIIDNRAGAGGVIGAMLVARAAPDGYTLLFTSPSTHLSAALLSKDMPYDPIKDFTPITAAMDSFQSLALSSAIPLRSLEELIDYAKRNPGKMSYGTAGIGTEFHLAGELFKKAAGVDLLHVPYKSAALALPGLVAGDISMSFSTLSAHLPYMRSGKVRILAILNPKRYPGLPEVPTVAEIVPGFTKPAAWQGYFGPAELPMPIVSRLNAEIKDALATADVRRQMDKNAQRAIGNSPEEFAAMIRKGLDDWAKAGKLAGIKPE